MIENQQPDRCSATVTGSPRNTCGAICVVLLVVLYAAGMAHDMSRPWTGLHDWNGAFFSQLARNLLRYPISVHHGMGVVAVGEAVPPPEERCFYAAHPPALIWLVALAFHVLGEAEWAARLVAIVASLGSLGLFVWLVKQWRGSETATLAGLLYAVMPMAVYFGRMVDHEAVCLFFMLAALACWHIATAAPEVSSRQVLLGRLGWVAAMFGVIWVDWSGVLFAGLFGIHALVQFWRGRASPSLALMSLGVPLVFTAVMLIHLIYGGLEGRASDLVAIVLSRTGNQEVEAIHDGFFAPEGPWRHIIGNVTWPMLLLAGVGFIQLLTQGDGRHKAASAPADTPDERRGVEGSWVLLATGVLWVALLWRQFERHNYWMFYLGPPIAVMAAEAMLAVRARLLPTGRRLADGVLYGAAAVVVIFALRGTDDYFAKEPYPREEVEAWRQIHDATGPNDRVLLYRDPVLPELRGTYMLRNIVPAQQTYYLDRPFGVEKNFAAVVERASAYAVYVVPAAVIPAKIDQLGELRSRFPNEVLGFELVFDLRSGSQ